MTDYGYVDVGKLADFANNTIGGLTANYIMRFPRADVKPVKRGKWSRLDYDIGHDYVCSVCKCKNDRKSRFCPDCGADMQNE